MALLLSVLVIFSSPVLAEEVYEGNYESAAVSTNMENGGTIKILMVGNSYTRYNNMPNMLRKICASKGLKVKVTYVTKSKACLSDFASKYTDIGKKVRKLLKTQKWDYVVLQERHYYPLTDVSKMKKAVSSLKPYIEEAGAKIFLYMTWAPESGHADYQKYKNLVSGKAEYQKKIARSYEYVARKTGAAVIPVGLAFEKAGKQSGYPALIGKDKSHPTKYGSYLAACTIYTGLFGSSSVGASAAGVKKSTARQLQKLSWKTWNSYTLETRGISQFY